MTRDVRKSYFYLCGVEIIFAIDTRLKEIVFQNNLKEMQEYNTMMKILKRNNRKISKDNQSKRTI